MRGFRNIAAATAHARALNGRHGVSKLNVAAAAAAGVAGAIAVGLAGAASAQDASAPSAPPSWDTLTRCAQMPADDARLACYDTAMRTAGYGPKPAEVAEEHRKKFGLPLPKFSAPKHHETEQASQGAPGAAPAPPPVNPDKVTVTVQEVATLQPGDRLLVITDEGQIWEQTDDTPLNQTPKSGDTMNIRRNFVGGYFCEPNKYQAVRCKRDK
jgi:photosystem II stability/assembly factor-like uncharacterized protein